MNIRFDLGKRRQLNQWNICSQLMDQRDRLNAYGLNLSESNETEIFESDKWLLGIIGEHDQHQFVAMNHCKMALDWCLFQFNWLNRTENLVIVSERQK